MARRLLTFIAELLVVSALGGLPPGAVSALASQSADKSAQALLPQLSLRVLPSLCLRYASGDRCELTVEIQWRDRVPSSYCLYSDQNSSEIQCWHEQASANLIESRIINRDLVYWLSIPGQSKRLVSAKIDVATIVKEQKRRRNKRRHIWNLI